MSVEAKNIIFHGSAEMPDGDVTEEIGGAIDKTIKMTFAPLENTGVLNVASENAGDTTQTITVSGRNAAGEKISEGIELNGLTEVPGSLSFERVMKAIKDATCVGAVALYSNTDQNAGTAQGGGADYITLASGASAVDNAYQFDVAILLTGTGAGGIREIITYNGTSKQAVVRDWDTAPDGTTTYVVAHGIVFDKAPNEISEVRREPYDAAANPTGGATKTYYFKFFVYNQHATLALTNAIIDEVDESLYDLIEFALETTLDGTGTNGAGNNRQVAPSSGIGSFDSAAKNVANSQSLSPVSGQGVWGKVTLPGGQAAAKGYYKLQTSGQSV